VCTHIAAGFYGIENNLGCVVTPLRTCFNRAKNKLLAHLPDACFQVVMRRNESGNLIHSGISRATIWTRIFRRHEVKVKVSIRSRHQGASPSSALMPILWATKICRVSPLGLKRVTISRG